jgi:hypothetical protein
MLHYYTVKFKGRKVPGSVRHDGGGRFTVVADNRCPFDDTFATEAAAVAETRKREAAWLWRRRKMR